MKKEKLPLLLIAAALVGVLLLVFGGADKTEAGERFSDAEYLMELEESVRGLCSAVRGVSDCEVKITLKSGYGYKYSSRGDVIGVDYPEICGVGVVCKGGEVPQIKLELTTLISATLGISAAQISVAGK